jgi:hypothetical protein
METIGIRFLRQRVAYWYTLVSGIFLLLQGTSTLLFRLIPPLDAAFPALLQVTQMVPIHSTLHIVTGLLALGILVKTPVRGTWWFALGFGAFYTALAVAGYVTHQGLGLGLQPFDHPFHLVLGTLGLLAAAVAERPIQMHRGVPS